LDPLQIIHLYQAKLITKIISTLRIYPKNKVQLKSKKKANFSLRKIKTNKKKLKQTFPMNLNMILITKLNTNTISKAKMNINTISITKINLNPMSIIKMKKYIPLKIMIYQ
jgi:hypothetical protein